MKSINVISLAMYPRSIMLGETYDIVALLVDHALISRNCGVKYLYLHFSAMD